MPTPNYPVIYYRDNDTRTALPSFDTVEKLIAEKPLQVIEIKDEDGMSVIGVVSAGEDNDVAEPIFSSEGIKSIFKQQVGAINEGITVTLMIPQPKFSDLIKLKSFSRQPNIERAYHEFGTIGFWFPTVPAFEIDPTNVIGLTLKPPIIEWGVEEVGQNFARVTLNFSLGGVDLK